MVLAPEVPTFNSTFCPGTVPEASAMVPPLHPKEVTTGPDVTDTKLGSPVKFVVKPWMPEMEEGKGMTVIFTFPVPVTGHPFESVTDPIV